jgi:hypothetical protein
VTSHQVYIEACPAQQENNQVENSDRIQPPGKGWHAQFAAGIKIREFDELLKGKWGLETTSLLTEVIERQKLFIKSQYFAGEPRLQPSGLRTLALRFIHERIGGRIQPALLVKVQAEDRESAITLANQAWQEMSANFPYDYILKPAIDQAAFLKASGWDWMRGADQFGCYAEICRYEGILSTGSQLLYLLGCWNESMLGNELIWRTLAGASQRIIMNITLRPVVLQDYELYILKSAMDQAVSIDKGTIHPCFHLYVDSAVAVYREMAANLHHPYLIRIHLASPEPIPEYIPRLIGNALTHPDKPAPATNGYQVVYPELPEEIVKLKQLLFWLEPDAYSTPGYDARFMRLRYMVDTQEAVSLFRLPFPPQGGIPGVRFI